MAALNLIHALKRERLVSEDDIRSARQLQGETGGQLTDILIRIGAIDEDQLLDVASAAWNVPRVPDQLLPDSYVEVDQALTELGISSGLLERHQAILWAAKPDGGEDEPVLVVGACNPLDPSLREAIGLALDRLRDEQGISRPVYWYVISKAHIDLINDLKMSSDRSAANGMDGDLSRLKELAEEAPIIDLVNQVFSRAIKHRASDVHIEPHESTFEVRYRIDGVMQTWQRFPKSKFDAASTRIKLISKMDIAERRLPQDGRQSIRLNGQNFDLRVSSLPGAWGESLVLRLLPKDSRLPSLDSLGLSGRSLAAFQSVLNQPNGIVLVTGPTGSGKSTTLYTGLQSINDGHKKIITIEDPIEFNMERVTQTQVKSDIGLTFAAGLRSILRQDPDVIMIGEIRDPETAKIAIQSSLTGHLVLSTLHTNSSLLAVPRLKDLGLEPFQIGAAVKAFAAQRLVRRVCPHCAEPVTPPNSVATLIEGCDEAVVRKLYERHGAGQWKEGRGCDACSGSGFSGRVALFEIVQVDDAVKNSILHDEPLPSLERAARTQGFRRLAEDGLEKAILGITTVSEVLRVASDDLASNRVFDPDDLVSP